MDLVSPKEYEKKKQELVDRYNFLCPLIYMTCKKPYCPLPIVSKCPRFPKWCLRFYCSPCKRTWFICTICIQEKRDYKCVRSLKERTAHNNYHVEQPDDDLESDNSSSSQEDVQESDNLPDNDIYICNTDTDDIEGDEYISNDNNDKKRKHS